MAALACLTWLACGPGAHAQGVPKVLGAQDCEKCHKPALKKWKLEEPAQLGPKAHANTHKQLGDPKAAKFAAAIGLADPADPGGRCVACHATVVRGSLRGGVSCESCHGPAGLYNPVHDKEPLAESYKKSLPLGLRDLHGKPAAIAAMCVGCHVTPDKALSAAGHPNGADFDPGLGLRKLVHWTAAFTGDGSEHASYDAAQVSALARPLVQKALAAGGPSRAASAKPAGAPPAAARGPSTGAASASAPPAPAPWDWDQPLPPLPEDYPSDGAAPAAGVEAARGDAPAPAAVPRVARRSMSITVDQPGLSPPELSVAPAAVEALAPAGSTSAAAALRGRVAALLAEMLERGQAAPGLPAPRRPQEFQGPDGELLNLQDVVLFLALETLRRRPPETSTRPAPARGEP